jgi:hypothetical protein
MCHFGCCSRHHVPFDNETRNDLSLKTQNISKSMLSTNHMSGLPRNSTVALIIRGLFGHGADDRVERNIILAAKSQVEMVCKPLLNLGNRIHLSSTLPNHTASLNVKAILEHGCGDGGTFKLFSSPDQVSNMHQNIDLIVNATMGREFFNVFQFVVLVRHDFGFTSPIDSWRADFSKFNFVSGCEPQASKVRFPRGCVNDVLQTTPGEYFWAFMKAAKEPEYNCFVKRPHAVDTYGHGCRPAIEDLIGVNHVGLLTPWVPLTTVRETSPIGCVSSPKEVFCIKSDG